MARLDALARQYVAEQAVYRAQYQASAPADAATHLFWERRAHVGRIMVIYRTLANPAFCDLSSIRPIANSGPFFIPGRILAITRRRGWRVCRRPRPG